jgi:hypothetical protein
MKFQQLAGFGLASLGTWSKAVAAVPAERLEERQASSSTAAASSTTSRVPDGQCTNSPSTRSCWKNGYSIATDFDKKFPTTGNTITYDWTITNTTCNPDGAGSRICLLVNGQYPGPMLHATWGDNVVVTVRNQMQDNATGVHWHGVRQWHSTGYDGVGGVTECPIAPGDSKTYYFQVTQFGSSWYHSHYSSQYGDGIVGPIVFDGPASVSPSDCYD